MTDNCVSSTSDGSCYHPNVTPDKSPETLSEATVEVVTQSDGEGSASKKMKLTSVDCSEGGICELSSEICAAGPNISSDASVSHNGDWSYLSNEEEKLMTPLALTTDAGVIGSPISSSSPSALIGHLTSNSCSLVPHDASLGDCSFLSSDSFVEEVSSRPNNPPALPPPQQLSVKPGAESASAGATQLTDSPTCSEDNDSGLGCNSNDEENEDDVDYDGRRISFGTVTVYYFSRTQGFTCVPAQGGSTLGMSPSHTDSESFSFTEYKRVRNTRKRHMIQLRLGGGSGHPPTGGELEPINVDEIDDSYFLEVVPLKKRRKLLRESGVSDIDISEYKECESIRNSREECGCNCRFVCDPRTCLCSLNGIKCQVDRQSYPCGCTKDGCGNQSGRIEFNLHRVRTHFFFTLLRVQSPFHRLHASNGAASETTEDDDESTVSTTEVESSSVGERGECNNRCCLGVASRTPTYPDESHTRFISEFYNANSISATTVLPDSSQLADSSVEQTEAPHLEEDEEEFEDEEEEVHVSTCYQTESDVTTANESLYMSNNSLCHDQQLVFSSDKASGSIEYYESVEAAPNQPQVFHTISTPAPCYTSDLNSHPVELVAQDALEVSSQSMYFDQPTPQSATSAPVSAAALCPAVDSPSKPSAPPAGSAVQYPPQELAAADCQDAAAAAAVAAPPSYLPSICELTQAILPQAPPTELYDNSGSFWATGNMENGGGGGGRQNAAASNVSSTYYVENTTQLPLACSHTPPAESSAVAQPAPEPYINGSCTNGGDGGMADECEQT